MTNRLFIILLCYVSIGNVLIAQRDSLKLTNSQRSELLAELNADAGKNFTPDSVTAMSDFLKGNFYNLGAQKSEMYCRLMLDCAFLTENEANVAMASHRTGHFYLIITELSNSLVYYNKAAAIRQKLGLEKDLANTWSNIALVYDAQAQYVHALEYNQKAEEIRQKLGLEIDLADTWNNMANVYLSQKQYVKALEYYQKAAAKYEKLGLEEAIADTWNNMGNLYQHQTQYTKALEYYQKVETIKQKFGLETDLAKAWNNMATVYQAQTRYAKALEYNQKAEIIRQKLGLEADLAATWNNMAIVYQCQTQYARALEYYQKSETIQQKLGLEANLAVTWNNIANVYESQTQYARALEYYQKSETIRQKLGLEADLAYTWNNMGTLYQSQTQYKLALEYYQKAETIQQKLGLEASLANTWNNMGIVYQSQSQYAHALEYFQKVKTIYEKLGLKGDLADIWNNIAIIYQIQTQYALALEYNQKAASLKIKSELPTDKTFAMLRLSDVYDKLSLPDSALYYAKESVKYAEEALAGSVDEKSTVKIQQDAYVAYEIAVKYATPKEAIQYGMRLKGRTLAKLLAERTLTNIVLTDTLAHEQEALNTELRFCELQLSKDQLDDSLKISFRNQRLNVLEKFDIFTSKLRRELPEYAALQYPEPLEIEALQKTLKKDETVVEYMMGNEDAFAFVTTRDGYTVVPLVKPDSITDWVAKFRENFVEKAQKGSFDRTVIKGFHKASFALYQLLVKPLEDKGLLNGKALMVIADGAISYVPFDCLVKDEKPSPKWDTYQYLIKEYAISYYPSALVLQRQRTVNNVKPAEKGFLAFGDPLFKGNQRLEDYKPDSLGFYVMRDNGFGEYLMPLPGTKSEVEGIAQLFPKTNKTFLRGEATEDNLKATDLTAYRYLHFATHGLINTAYPELSAIALTQDDNPAQDGTVNMFEIFNLKTNADLVVLSACETGLGKVIKGEGMVGFTRGLMYAGARSVVLSLWSVADNSTSALMQDFYKKVVARKSTKQNSLRSIQLELLKEGNAYACPFYWAPFILVGER